MLKVLERRWFRFDGQNDRVKNFRDDRPSHDDGVNYSYGREGRSVWGEREDALGFPVRSER
eukprot:COSAG04_NODE_2360_length_4275_cov_2.918822_1_plen_60_part_10